MTCCSGGPTPFGAENELGCLLVRREEDTHAQGAGVLTHVGAFESIVTKATR